MTVNLIPTELRHDQIRRKHLQFWLIAIVACFVVAVVCVGLRYNRCLKVRKDLQLVEQESRDINKQIQSCGSAQDTLMQWQGRLALQRRLSLYPLPSQVLSYLAGNSPSLIHLEELSFHRDEKTASSALPPRALPKAAQMFITKQIQNSNTDTIDTDVNQNDTSAGNTGHVFTLLCKGKALNYQAVADFVETLRATALFYNIEPKTITRDTASPQVLAFEIECFVLPYSQSETNHANLQKTSNF